MAKQIVITCDAHADRGEDGVPAIPREFPRGLDHRKQLVVIDLCDDDYKLLTEPLVDLLDRYGQTSHSPPMTRQRRRRVASGRDEPAALPAPAEGVDRTDPGIYPCPFDDCDKHDHPYSRRTSINQHMQMTHGTSLQAYEAEHGNINQHANPEWQAKIEHIECRWCERDDFRSNQSVGRHERWAHPQEFEAAGGGRVGAA